MSVYVIEKNESAEVWQGGQLLAMITVTHPARIETTSELVDLDENWNGNVRVTATMVFDLKMKIEPEVLAPDMVTREST